jgi:DNA-binding NarL/FixJ family response regulator
MNSPPPFTERVVPDGLPLQIRIAVIEDDASLRQILCEWFRRAEGFSCVFDVGSAEQAIERLAQAEPDVTLVDINLPRMSGVEVVRRMKSKMHKTQFLMLTVYDDANHVFEALAAGASGYLLKRTPKAQLLEAVREVHAGGSPMTSSIARIVVQSLRRPSGDGSQEEGLSRREAEVLNLLAKGFLYKEIADFLQISLPTVSTYVRRIYEKLHVHSRAQAVARYTEFFPRS